ncbi:hypothetical protein Tco_0792981 [Tanacetum coccineum]
MWVSLYRVVQSLFHHSGSLLTRITPFWKTGTTTLESGWETLVFAADMVVGAYSSCDTSSNTHATSTFLVANLLDWLQLELANIFFSLVYSVLSDL